MSVPLRLHADNRHNMALITLSNAQLAFGHVALLDHADFSLESGERVGLIGRNGAGKSSLLRILEGTRLPDDGEPAGRIVCLADVVQHLRDVRRQQVVVGLRTR